MPLKHEKPSIEYMRELKATAKAADDMLNFFLSGPHIPNDFPKDQILRHCEALVLLPEGTAGGSIVTLEAADADLTRIQQNHIPLPPDDDEEPSDDLRSSIERGGEVDSKLTEVNKAVRLAIECYRRESGDAIETDTSPEPSHGPNIDEERRATTDDATALEDAAHAAAANFDAIRNIESESADAFHRTLKDAEAQARSTKGVLQHQNPRPGVTSKLDKGLAITASIIDKSGKGLELGSDIGKDCNNTWAELQRQGIDGVLTAIGTVGSSLRKIAKTINRHREEWKSEQQFTPENFDYVEVYNRLLRGKPVPDAWAPLVTQLDFWQVDERESDHHLSDQELMRIDVNGMKFNDLRLIENCTNIQILYTMNTEIADIEPLLGFQKLHALTLSGSKIKNLHYLKNCKQLLAVHLGYTEIDSIDVFKYLKNLRSIYISNTEIEDISSLKNLQKINILRINDTKVSDLGPLKNCTALKELYIQNTKVTDISVLDHIEGLTIYGPKEDEITTNTPQ